MQATLRTGVQPHSWRSPTRLHVKTTKERPSERSRSASCSSAVSIVLPVSAVQVVENEPLVALICVIVECLTHQDNNNSLRWNDNAEIVINMLWATLQVDGADELLPFFNYATLQLICYNPRTKIQNMDMRLTPFHRSFYWTLSTRQMPLSLVVRLSRLRLKHLTTWAANVKQLPSA